MAPTNLGLQLETMIRSAHYMIPAANSSIPASPLSGPYSFLSASRNIVRKHMHLLRDVVSSTTLQGNKYTGPHNNKTTTHLHPITPHGVNVDDMIEFTVSFVTVALMCLFIVALVMLAFHAVDFAHRNGYTRELRVQTVRRQYRRRRHLQERRDFVSKMSAEFSADVDIEAGKALASDSLKTTLAIPSYGAMDSSDSS